MVKHPGHDERDPWADALRALDFLDRLDEPGGFVQWVRGRIVVDAAALDPANANATEVRGRLERAKARQTDADADVLKPLGLTTWELADGDADLPGLVRELRAAAPHSASLDIARVGDPHRMGGTSPAIPADRPRDIPGRGKTGRGIQVVVLDTGLEDESAFGAVADPADDERLDDDGDGALDPAAGHGTFVTSLIRRGAPGAEVLVRTVLRTPAGVASDTDVARALRALPAGTDLVNCSFGGPGLDDAPSLILERAIAALPYGTVVVASAGNQSERRPHFPAALKHVIGVGSVELRADAWELADYSNRGPWLDASAPGSGVDGVFVEFAETKAGDPAIDRTFKGGATWSGTSFAAPQVTAAIARVAAEQGVPTRLAAALLLQAPGRPRIADGGALVV